jgi:hypothetical protein
MNIFPNKYRKPWLRWLEAAIQVVFLVSFTFLVWCIGMIIEWGAE